MIVEYKKHKIYVCFKDLKVGDIFSHEGFGKNYIYMKMENLSTDNHEYNTVDLEDGNWVAFNDDEPVIKINAKLVIE